jgi:hypothetical protein
MAWLVTHGAISGACATCRARARGEWKRLPRTTVAGASKQLREGTGVGGSGPDAGIASGRDVRWAPGSGIRDQVDASGGSVADSSGGSGSGSGARPKETFHRSGKSSATRFFG